MKASQLFLGLLSGVCLIATQYAHASPGLNTALGIGKTASTGAAMVGGTFYYQLAVTNLGPNPLTQATIQDTLPQGVQYLSSAGTGAYNSSDGQWTFGALSVGAVAIMTIQVQAASPGAWLNTATITSSTPSDTNAANSASAEVMISPLADPPIVLTCSSNLTVTATGANGATVYFGSSAYGGCSNSVFVTSTPPSGSTFPIGTTFVMTTAHDSCGDTTNCQFTVTVNPPVYPPIVLTCSSNLTVTATSSKGVTVYFGTSAYGGCSNSVFVNSTPPSGSTFPIGTTFVMTTASDGCGDSTNCQFTVTVNPPVNPPIVLTCSSNLTVTATGSNGATVYFGTSAYGGCSNSVFVTSTPPSGSTFPIGTTFVMTTAHDSCGDSTNCEFTVTVNPPTFPPIALNCSSNLFVTATSTNGATVFFSAYASGGCSNYVYVTSTPPSGSFFPIGVTRVYTTATDPCGNSTNCQFTVTVNPPAYPPIVLNCSSNLSVTATSTNGATVFFSTSASGGCNGSNVMLTSTPPSGSFFPVGVTTVYTTATDTCGNHTNCQFTVTVNPPGGEPATNLYSSVKWQLFLQFPDFHIEAIPLTGLMAMTSSVGPEGQTTDTDTNGLAYVATEMTSLNLSGTSATLGPISLTLNPNQVSSGVIEELTNTVPGILNVPPFTPSGTASSFFDIFTEISLDGGAALYPTEPVFFTGTITNFPFGLGDTLFDSATIPLADINGNPTGYSLVGEQLTANPVTNSLPIELACSSNLVVTATEPGGAYPLFNVTASGGCGALNLSTYPSAGAFFPVGTTTVYAIASDDCGDATNCSFTVTVVLPPLLLDCSSNLTVTADGPGGATVYFNTVVGGGCDASPYFYSQPPSGSIFPVGTTTVTTIANDSCGDTTNCTFTVTVVSPPIELECSSNLTVTATGTGGATVFFNASASGGCTPPSVSSAPPSGSTFPIGTTTVTTVASDTCGNSTNCTFTVTVTPPTYPPLVINCSSNLSLTATSFGGTPVFFNVTASGGCNPPPFVTSTPPSGSTFPIGTTTVATTASDSCGDSTNCVFTVTVNPPVYPPIVLNCSSNISVTATSASGTPVFFTVTASGGCSLPTVTAYPPSGSTFPVGVTTVTTVAADTCGNSTNCSFTVTVARPPIELNCSSNLTVAATSSAGTPVFFTVTASGGCSPPTIFSYPPSGSTFPIGVTTVSTTAGDACDTLTNCIFTVTVNPSTNVVVTTGTGPMLSIQLNTSNGIVFAWPTNDPTPYVISQIPSLDATNWQTLSNLPVVVGGSNQVVITLTNTQGFFRLTTTNVVSGGCVVSLTLTNCDAPESVTLTPPATTATLEPGDPVNLAATLNVTPGLLAVVSYYTNTASAGTNCPSTTVTNLVEPTILSSSWTAVGPGGYSASGPGLDAVFTPTSCGSGTVQFTTTWRHVCDPGQSTTFASGSYNLNCATNCLIASVTTNCLVAGSMALTNRTAVTNFCLSSPGSASVTNFVTTNSVLVVTTLYTNSAGAMTTNCPPTYVTNTVAPTVVSNWWTVSGPGSYTNSGAGATATFTPTNGGSGVVIFRMTFANNTPCATNAQTAAPISVPFNVIQITNQCVSPTPTNRARLLVGVGEQVNLALAGAPGGTFTWSTTAGGVNPAVGPATTFTAPTNSANGDSTVTVTYPGGSCPLVFNVIVPTGILGSNRNTISYTVNRAAAGMVNYNWLLPKTVSFYRVSTQEVPATNNINITGYFANTNFFNAGNPLPMHTVAVGAGSWVGTRFDNYNGNDTAASGTTLCSQQPWAAGSFTWPIPVVWRIPGGLTNYLENTDQTFTLSTNGTMSIIKYGITKTRGTNNVYAP